MQLKRPDNYLRYPQSGMTLIEVVVSIFVVSMGLLGLGLLLAKGQQVADESYQRFLAASVTHEFVERLTANAAQATVLATTGTNSYIHTTAIGGSAYTPTKDCGTADCTPAELADYDVANLVGALRGVQKMAGSNPVAGLLSAQACISVLGANTATSPRHYLVTIVWQGRESAGTPEDGSAAGTEAAKCATDITVALGRRSLYTEVQVVQ